MRSYHNDLQLNVQLVVIGRLLVLEVIVGHLNEESEASQIPTCREADEIAIIVDGVEVGHKLGTPRCRTPSADRENAS